MSTVSSLTESQLVERIRGLLPPPPDWLVVGIGDDAAVLTAVRNRLEVLTIDAIVEGVHFDRCFTPPDAIGHRALAVNLSDLAAMGAEPRLALLSLALPCGLPLRRLRRARHRDGGARAAARHAHRRRQPDAIAGPAHGGCDGGRVGKASSGPDPRRRAVPAMSSS